MATRKKRGRKKTSRKTTRKSGGSVKTELGHVIKVLQTIKKHC